MSWVNKEKNDFSKAVAFEKCVEVRYFHRLTWDFDELCIDPAQIADTWTTYKETKQSWIEDYTLHIKFKNGEIKKYEKQFAYDIPNVNDVTQEYFIDKDGEEFYNTNPNRLSDHSRHSYDAYKGRYNSNDYKIGDRRCHIQVKS